MSQDELAHSKILALDIVPMATSFVNHLRGQFGPYEECVATLKGHLPHWNGKVGTPSDLNRLIAELDRKFKISRDSKANLPNEVSVALIGVLAEEWGDKTLDAISAHFNGLDLLQVVAKIWRVFTSSVKARKMGGLASKRWTADIDQKARDIFNELKRSNPSISDDAAFQRTSALLKVRHNESFSRSTVKRYLGKLSNA